MECRSCRHFNPATAVECELCHKPLRTKGGGIGRVGKPESKDSLAGPPSLRLVLNCQQCGEQNLPGVTRCRKCGEALQRHKVQLSAPITTFRHKEIVHYLICPPLSPTKLPADRRLVIGRSEAADISLPGELVSRSHASITCQDGVYFLTDLGSANGTYYKGHKIDTPVKLVDDDAITIGGFHLRYLVRQGHAISNTSVLRDLSSLETRELNLSEVENELQSTAATAFAGRLEEVTLVAVLLFLRDQKHSGVLKIASGGGSGRITIVGGEMLQAECAIGPFPSRGKEAILKLAHLRKGTFAFEQGSIDATPGEHRLREPTEMLLQELQALQDLQDGD